MIKGWVIEKRSLLETDLGDALLSLIQMIMITVMMTMDDDNGDDDERRGEERKWRDLKLTPRPSSHTQQNSSLTTKTKTKTKKKTDK